MHREPVALATSIVRNSVALMAVGVLAKGMGLVLAVLIARFLGPSSMGLFALLFSIALLIEYMAPLGLQDVLIREVAAHPRERVRLWKQASTLAVSASLVPSAAFLVAAFLTAIKSRSGTACSRSPPACPSRPWRWSASPCSRAWRRSTTSPGRLS